MRQVEKNNLNIYSYCNNMVETLENISTSTESSKPPIVVAYELFFYLKRTAREAYDALRTPWTPENELFLIAHNFNPLR